MRPFLMLGIMLVLLPAAVMQARVFRRVGWLSGVTRFDVEGLGKKVYQTVMRINGGQAEVSVVACREGVDGLRQILASGESVTTRFAASTDLGVGEINGMGRNVRLIAFAPGKEGEDGLIVAVEQTGDTHASLRSSAARHELRDIPLFPGGRVTGFMRNESSRTAWETATVTAAPVDAVSFYQTAMKQAGWMQMFPPPPSPYEEGMLCFVRGTDICCVQVGPSDSDGETQLALLHKRGALN